MPTRELINELRNRLTPENYAENKAAWDALAFEIQAEGMDAWYIEHKAEELRQ
jgi:hypothetical protein